MDTDNQFDADREFRHLCREMYNDLNPIVDRSEVEDVAARLRVTQQLELLHAELSLLLAQTRAGQDLRSLLWSEIR